MDTIVDSELEGAALESWRSYLQSHASIVRVLDAELVAEHGITARDYEVLLYLAQADEGHLPMSALAERTMLTRSGITRLVDGLVVLRTGKIGGRGDVMKVVARAEVVARAATLSREVEHFA